MGLGRRELMFVFQYFKYRKCSKKYPKIYLFLLTAWKAEKFLRTVVAHYKWSHYVT